MPPGKERDIQILRLSMIAELDAVNLYSRFAELASDGRVSTVMKDVAHEEKVHAGEFEELMEYLDPNYEEAEEEGEEEVKKMTGI
jgi:rubrerythrin